MKTENRINPANEPEAKEAYAAPAVEIVEVMVERGFQASGDESDDLSGDPDGRGSY